MRAKERLQVCVVRLPSRGQVTIPAEFRRQLGLDEGDLLQITLREGKMEIEPVVTDMDKVLRDYTEEEIRQFLEEDRIDRETAVVVRRLPATDAP